MIDNFKVSSENVNVSKDDVKRSHDLLLVMAKANVFFGRVINRMQVLWPDSKL